MAYCKDCWNFDRCNAIGRTVDYAVDDGVCLEFDECKPITNADRIRAMSDEELAEWLEWFVIATVEASGMQHDDFEDGEREKLLELLKQPAEEERL